MSALNEVRSASAVYRTAKEAHEAAIVRAHGEGHPIKHIAEHAGMGRQSVYNIVGRRTGGERAPVGSGQYRAVPRIPPPASQPAPRRPPPAKSRVSKSAFGVEHWHPA